MDAAEYSSWHRSTTLVCMLPWLLCESNETQHEAL